MILNDLFESKMSEIDIEYQDFLNSRGKKAITDKEFQDAYGMTRTEWAKKNKEWTWQKERQPVAPDAHVMHEEIDEDWQKVNKKDRTAGMSKKAVKAYRRENPGSKLQTAVTTKPSKLKKGSKSAKRRSSYCSRSKGQMDMHNISCQKTPDKAICAARRRWNCEESIEEGLKDPKDNPCWKGYKPVGTKKKNGRTVPNCVPKE